MWCRGCKCDLPAAMVLAEGRPVITACLPACTIRMWLMLNYKCRGRDSMLKVGGGEGVGVHKWGVIYSHSE